MRFQLANDERELVVALKKACESAGINYRSIFELAKYTIVVNRRQRTMCAPEAMRSGTAQLGEEV